MYPLTYRYKGRDILRKARTAYLRGVSPVDGPTGIPNTAYKFVGSSASYIQFPNNGKLDTKSALTLIAWVSPEQAGPIFNYQTNGWGVHLWATRPNQLFVRFVRRNGRSSPAVVSNRLRRGTWNYVAATYSKRSGIALLYINGRRVARRYIGRFTLRTQSNVRMGARIGDRRYFKGLIACMQVYNRALTRRQILAVMYRCTKGIFIVELFGMRLTVSLLIRYNNHP